MLGVVRCAWPEVSREVLQAWNFFTCLDWTLLRRHLKLGENAIAWLFGEIRARFDRALAHPGEMVRG